MKYFVQTYKGSKGAAAGVIDTRPFEVVRGVAQMYYRRYVVDQGFDATDLMVRQMTEAYLNSGDMVGVGNCELYVWGEKITDRELFRKRLSGEIANTVIA